MPFTTVTEPLCTLSATATHIHTNTTMWNWSWEMIMGFEALYAGHGSRNPVWSGKEAHWLLRGWTVKSAEHCAAGYKPLDRKTAYSTSGITSGKKSFVWPQNGGHFENLEILDTDSIWPPIWKDSPKLCQKPYFSWWWHHQWRQVLELGLEKSLFDRIQFCTLYNSSQQDN